MPPAIQASYQYFTQAPIENLRRTGYPGQFAPLEHSVRDYVTDYLDAADRYR
jgi:ADP-L-glycero-D-manno-heptose 6-epimerase